MIPAVTRGAALHLSHRYIWHSVILLIPIVLMNNVFYGRLGNGIDYVSYWLNVPYGCISLPLCIFSVISICLAARSFSYQKSTAAKVIFLLNSLYIVLNLISIPAVF